MPNPTEHDPSQRGRSERWTKLAPIAGLVVIALAAIVHALYYLPRTVDDMFIFLRYAESIAAGDGVVYNPGERVEGLSSPIWTLLLALGERLGIGGVSWSKTLGLTSFAGLMWGTHRFAREVCAASRLARRSRSPRWRSTAT